MNSFKLIGSDSTIHFQSLSRCPCPATVNVLRRVLPKSSLPEPLLDFVARLVRSSDATPPPLFDRHVQQLHVQHVVELQILINKERAALESQTTSNDPDIQLRKQIAARVMDRLRNARNDVSRAEHEQIRDIYHSLWEHTIERSGGEEFLRKLLEEEYKESAENQLIPTKHYLEVERWVSDATLIEFASRIKDAPTALNQSPQNHAHAIRAWLNNPKNVRSINHLNLTGLHITHIPEIKKLMAFCKISSVSGETKQKKIYKLH